MIKKYLVTPLLNKRKLTLVMSFTLLGLLLWWADPSEVAARLGRFSIPTLTALLTLLTMNLFFVLLRSWRITAHFGIHLPFIMTVRANMAGYAAGLFFIPLLAQVAGRQAIFQRVGVPPAVNSGLVAYERALLTLMSGGLAAVGALHLLGNNVVRQFMDRLAFGQVALAVCSGAALSLYLGRGHFEKNLFRDVLAWKNAANLLQDIFITFTALAAMLSGFVVVFLTVAPQIDLTKLLAAAAVISFSASLPISFGGWGPRELTTVYVLGQLGVAPADALAASVVIGMGSMLTTLLVAGVALSVGRYSGDSVGRLGVSTDEAEIMIALKKKAAWIIGFSAALTVFFQLHVAWSETVVNLNLADPFAILALGALSLQAVFERKWPLWRFPQFQWMLLAISLLLLFGFVWGYEKIGITSWAVNNRLFGWLVLLGYLSAGYLIVESHGAHGMRRFTETVASVACVIIMLQVFLRLLNSAGIHPFGLLTPNFEGYAGNRNAFVFQLLIVLSLIMGYSRVWMRRFQKAGGTALPILYLTQGIIVTGIVLTGSRAALGTTLIMLLLAWFSRLVDRRIILWGLIIAGLLWAGIQKTQSLITEQPAQPVVTELPAQPVVTKQPAYLQSPFSTEMSDQARWDANRHAFEMWLQSPITGTGLGVFAAKSAQWFNFPMIIHSTPIWILAEFGLIGIAIFGAFFYMMLRHVFNDWKRWPKLPAERALLFALLAFAIFSQVHEMLYQRILWLMLGVLLARPSIASTVVSVSKGPK
jgi:uncharacterized membrane protein YbhN (UPF0104 family)